MAKTSMKIKQHPPNKRITFCIKSILLITGFFHINRKIPEN